MSASLLPEHLHADLAQRVVLHTEDIAWIASPESGVLRRPLDRIGGEQARATSVVRYEPGSRFRGHEHPGGEEILVLDGVFSDEHGHHRAGTYLRNPPGSRHAPFSEEGCTLLVKLRQFHPQDGQTLRTDTRTTPWRQGLVPGLRVMPLHEFDGVNTALVHWAPDTRFNRHVHPGGEEIFVLEGLFEDEHGRYPAGTWLRNPPWSEHTPFTGPQGALIWVKVGHLGLQAA